MPPKVSKEFLKSLKDAGATDAVIGLFKNTGGSEEQPTKEKLPPLLGLGTQGTGVTSTQGALNSDRTLNVPKIRSDGRGDGLKPTMNEYEFSQKAYDYDRLRKKVGNKALDDMDDSQLETARSDQRAADFKYQALSKDRQKFFGKPVRRSNTKLGAEGKLGETKEVYSPRREMRRAMRVGDVLRKRGYGDVASDVVRGSLGGAVAPSIQSPEMRAAMYQQNIEAQQLDKANQEYMRKIMAQKFNEDQFKIGGV